MSRSCQSGTFSSPTDAAARTTRARPQIRSETIGLRLWGMAEEPFWPRPNGSSTSRTSVRARCRISSANRSSEVARSASGIQQLGVAVALQDLCRARRRLEPEPLAGDPLHLRIGRRVGADRARELADPDPFERARDAHAVSLERERPAGELEPERRRLGVHSVGAPDRQCLSMLVRARNHGPQRALDAGQDEGARLAELECESGVEDVGRGEAVVEEPATLAELLGDRVDEGGDVVLSLGLELGNTGRRRQRPPAPRSRPRPPAARPRSRPTPRAPRARPRATVRALPRPTRFGSSPDGSSAGSRQRV